MKSRPRRTRHLRGLACLGLLLLTATPARAVTAAHFWSKAFGGSAYPEFAQAVAVDAVGNVIVAGTFQGTAGFGGASLTSAGSEDIFLAKYNPSGVHLWSKRFGGAGSDQVADVAVDAIGYIHLTGRFTLTTNLGGSNLASAGLEDVFVARYRGDGTHVVSNRYGGIGTDIAASVAVGATGDIMVTGLFTDTANFGGGALASAGSADMFLASYNANLFFNWAQRFGSAGLDYGTALATDAGGNVCVAGRFQGTAAFGGAPLVSAGSDDVFIARYSAGGVHQWSRRGGGPDIDIAEAIAFDGGGSVFVTGSFQGTAAFGGSPLTSAGDFDAFLAKYDAGGNPLWSRACGGIGFDSGYSTATDANGDVTLVGVFNGTASCGGPALVSAGSADIFFARYDTGSEYQWSTRFGGSGYDQVRAVAIDAGGHSAVAGYFSGTAGFGGTPLASAGGSVDAFVARYGAEPAEPVIRSIDDVPNDQGRRVRITFARSGLDDPVSPVPVTGYEAYLRIGPPSAGKGAGPGDGFPSRQQLLAEGWDFVGSVPAHGQSEYLLGAPTDADSTIAAGQRYSSFFLRAATGDPVVFHDAPVDSGYSVDNLAPPAPAGLAYEAGALSWLASTAADFAYFSVYGSSSPVFDASAVLVGRTTGTSLAPGAAPYTAWFATATDFSGNEGPAAAAQAASGTGGTPGPRVLAVSAYPNPFNPRTTIRYDLPAPGRVTVRIYDAAGSLVTTLVDAVKSEGSHSTTWEGLDDRAARAGSGVYFVSVDAGGSATMRKIVMVK